MLKCISQILLIHLTFHHFIIKCDRDYYNMRQLFYYNYNKRLLQKVSDFLLKNATVLLKYVTVITKCVDFTTNCESYYKVRCLL